MKAAADASIEGRSEKFRSESGRAHSAWEDCGNQFLAVSFKFHKNLSKIVLGKFLVVACSIP